MKKILSVLFFIMCLGISSRAQVFIFNESAYQERMGEIKVTVVDSLTNEPIPFASVYVIPSKDTTITNFTLTDAKGEAKLDEVPFGSYQLHVEMMGYRPFIRERYFREAQVNMGTIRLQVDELFLQAATVTDVGNPIVIKKDTVEFNASSFRVGANAMLKDLLLRMPGMEITDDGKVKFNGKEIDKITVGGRTFFFNDQSTALNNLPASVVDKIRVIERESEQTRASGLEDGGKEQVLDVALKKEYEKGWFGNIGLKGGTTLGDSSEENPLRDDRGFVWSANALVSAYSDKDQLTFIANGQNIDDSGMIVSGMDEDGVISILGQGLSTAGQLGLNANTSRIKGVESTFSVNYKYTDTDSGNKSDRTTYLDDGDLNSSTLNKGKQYANSLSTNLEMKKEEGKVWFHFRPSFVYSKTDNATRGSSQTFREGTFVNSTETGVVSVNESKNTSLNSDLSFRDLGGKKGRTLLFGFNGSYDYGTGKSDETNLLKTASGTTPSIMNYLSDALSTTTDGSVRFTEPVGDKWSVSAMGELTRSQSEKTRYAYDIDGRRNSYYSTLSINKYMEQQYDLTAQYKFGESNWVTLGGRVYGVYNETYSESFGLENTVGEDEWNWHLAPTLRMRFSKENDEVNLYVTGYAMQPGTSRMQPMLNIADPSRLTLGNIYLKPYSQTYFNFDWTRSNPEKFSTLMVILFGNLNASPVSQARWFDSDGVMYSIPVNARKPATNGYFMVDYTTPLDKKKNLFLSVSSYTLFSSSANYQAKNSLPGLDKSAFDYSAFMSEFWGNASGDRFYSGQSGFVESRTSSFNPYLYFYLRYNRERYSLSLNTSLEGNIARYSLDPNINMNTLNTRIGVQGNYTTKHEFELSSEIIYNFYKGYSDGYGKPEWQWSAEINKSIGAFNFSVKMNDILNQTRDLTHTVTANYKEDTYRLVMGRYVIFGVKWNFGKMNASHSQRAQQAAMDMVF